MRTSKYNAAPPDGETPTWPSGVPRLTLVPALTEASDKWPYNVNAELPWSTITSTPKPVKGAANATVPSCTAVALAPSSAATSIPFRTMLVPKRLAVCTPNRVITLPAAGLFTGLFGILLGQTLLALLPLRMRIARGAPFGAAAHGFGLSVARQVGRQEGAVASLTMIFSGILMVLLAPLLGHLLT